MALTTTEKISLWQNEGFKQDVRYCANIIALFIVSEPNYGIDLANPSDPIQVRLRSFWDKRFNLAFSFIKKPDDQDLFKMLMYAISSGNFNIPCPVTFVAGDPVYDIWNDITESDSIAGYIKAIWDDLAGVKSNEYPWAGENGVILQPSDPNWYADHYGNLSARF